MVKRTPVVDDSELEFFQRTFGFLYEPEPRQRLPHQRRPDIRPLAEVAAELGITAARAQQIEQQALKKLRRIAEQHGLRELLAP